MFFEKRSRRNTNYKEFMSYSFSSTWQLKGLKSFFAFFLLFLLPFFGLIFPIFCLILLSLQSSFDLSILNLVFNSIGVAFVKEFIASIPEQEDTGGSNSDPEQDRVIIENQEHQNSRKTRSSTHPLIICVSTEASRSQKEFKKNGQIFWLQKLAETRILMIFRVFSVYVKFRIF